MRVHFVRDHKSASSSLFFVVDYAQRQGTYHPKSDANSIKLVLIHVLNYYSLLLDSLGSFIKVAPVIRVKRAIASLKKAVGSLVVHDLFGNAICKNKALCNSC
jgi:hypothetical protein